MRTLAIDHSVVTNQAWWPALTAAVGCGEIRLQLSVWNLVEIGFAEDTAQQRQRLDFLTGLKPWWVLERLQIQKQEVERFLWAQYFGVDPKPLVATTEFLSVVDSYFAGALTRVGLTPHRFIAETDFKLLQAAKKYTPAALRTLQSAGKAKLRQAEKAMFEAWIKPNIPDTDANGRLLKVIEKETLLQFCYERKDAFFGACRAIAAEDALSVARTSDTRRSPTESDGADLQHAVIGLAYSDMFATADGYQGQCALVAQKVLDTGYATVLRTPEELAAVVNGTA
jgi:hypothetical protein